MCALKVLVVSFSFALLTSYSVYKNLTGGLRADGCHIWKAIIALITSATATKNADSADKPSKFGWKMEKQSDRSEIKILWSFFCYSNFTQILDWIQKMNTCRKL